ncbi:endonuclease/exonuclease/phosphatase family protein [Marinomonas rhizomae]|uniref:Endonuclease/exonuclease/phosphatase (EEP) superfamily protein YafD n=1 Tax=Marinomonas rhizomae TaxID=491948 RepID=A0A366IVH6_9GAMM|nr:endonuclease/exonuclease/phosphatase family protein [Marinomonas rhizomae]RBP78024.1 endonuclease/exonuclease/phosphatase (EEP) superfamily protein YafD [Marinomonas rhizomae]RNF69250.1 endonuclease/exonuclease/phosphatase family protein [Marinomonas rhizomae]
MIKSRYSAVESLKVMGSASKECMGPNIEVLLWNVFKCKRKGWQSDFLSLTRDRDLVLLQEAILNSPFDGLFNHSLHHQWIMASSFRDLKSNIETGVKTGSSVVASKHFFSVSDYSEPVTNTKKMVLATEYPLVNSTASFFTQRLLVINSHMINFVSFERFRAHLDQAFQALEHHNGPILFAGDFNTWNKKRMQYFDTLAMSCSLKEVPIMRQPRLGHLFRHLDHVYCRGLSVVDVHVHTDIHSSDHYPISLSLRLSDD